jgi:hypothetical protein
MIAAALLSIFGLMLVTVSIGVSRRASRAA